MSLLMEALKKAERAKQAQEQGAQSGTPADVPAAGESGLQLAQDHPGFSGPGALPDAAPAADDKTAEAAAPETAPRTPARDLRQGRVDFPKLELESIDDREFDLDPVQPRAPRQAPAASAETAARSRAAARTVFDAKMPDAAAPSRMPMIAGSVVVVAVLGVGGYFLWQLMNPPSGLVNPQKVGGQVAQRSAAPAPGAAAVPQAAPAPLAPPVSSPAASGPANAVAAPSGSGEAAARVPSSPSRLAQSEPARPSAAKPAGEPVGAVGQAGPPKKIASGPARSGLPARIATANQDRGPGGLRVSPSTLTIDPALDEAYRAYAANDMATARNRYRAVLDADSGNRDALLGLAGVAARERRFDEAESFYLRALQTDPGDAYAQAGLIAIRSQADPVLAESRMKTLVANQPDAAFLHHALGNLYAKQGRWNEAQQEHFRAFSIESDNPDYCYNLAVSLDQMRQPQSALAHYQRALALSTSRPASFDPSQLRARISDLQKP